MKQATQNVVTYYRVSTSKQGLGIEAQKTAVSEYLAAHPEITEIGSFTETYTGKEANRPEFSKAIALCKRSGATLLAAKLDRLGRGKFLYTLMGDASVNFKVLDITGDSELEKTIRVAVAIEERKTISARTSAALQAKADMLAKAGEAYNAGDMDAAQRWIELAEAKSRAKRGLEWWAARGFRLGSTHTHSDAEREATAKRRKMEAYKNPQNIEASNYIREYLADGGTRSLTAIAKYLNEHNCATPRGLCWTEKTPNLGWKPQSVKNLMERFGL